MNKERAMQLVAALRSGEYTQAQKRLRNGDSFCCMGVACDLYRKEHPETSSWTLEAQEPGVYNGGGRFLEGNNYHLAILPPAVMTWFGFKNRVGSQVAADGSHIERFTLTELNDRGYCFDEIADEIEQCWEQL